MQPQFRFNGLYRAEVVNNNDPQRLCRLQVRVFSLYQEMEKADLPWAAPCFAMGGSANSGAVFLPPVASTVWVAFEEGNPNIPVWLGAYYGKPGGQPETPAVFRGVPSDPAASDSEPLIDESVSWQAQYPTNFGVRTPGGIVIEYDDTPGSRRIHLFHPSGSHLEFRENGDVVLHVKGNFHLVVDGNVEELVKLNRNEVVQQNHAVQVGGEKQEQIGANLTQIIAALLTIQATGKNENILGASNMVSTGVVTIQGTEVLINP